MKQEMKPFIVIGAEANPCIQAQNDTQGAENGGHDVVDIAAGAMRVR